MTPPRSKDTLKVGQRWRVYSVERRKWYAATITVIVGRNVTLTFDANCSDDMALCITPVEFLFDKPDMFQFLGLPG